MTQNGLNRYNGPLSAGEISLGMNAARRNAERLALDAKLLFDNGRYASALTLGVLSIEESGKVGILRGLATATDAGEVKDSWRHYRSHRSKNAGWTLPTWARRAVTFEERMEAEDPAGAHTALLENLKQLATYTDCLGNKHWSGPDEVIDESIVKYVVLTALTFVAASADEITAKEVELWIEHVGPVMKDNTFEELEKGFRAWQGAMHEHGLLDQATDELNEFVGD